jgi:hypothetical protein
MHLESTTASLLAELFVGLVAFSLASADLAIDLLHLAPTRLPNWQWAFGRELKDRRAKETKPWHRLVRQTFDVFILAVAVSAAVAVWLPFENTDAQVKAVTVAFGVGALAWILYLFSLHHRGTKV